MQLGFQVNGSYLGLDDVTLTPVSGASIKSAARAAADFQLVWNTTSGTVYQPQYKTTLYQPDWINLGSTITANADTIMMTDTNVVSASHSAFLPAARDSTPVNPGGC